jgi:hypothetical protein
MFNSLNDLILRNTLTVGSKLPSSNIKLPPKDFCYGKKGIPDKEGVSVGICPLIQLQGAGCFIQILGKSHR